MSLRSLAGNIGNQFSSLAKLPGQIFKTGIAGYRAYEGKEKLKVLQNQKNPMYGARPYGVPSYKKGGKVKKTGLALLHKGETVIPVGNKKKRTLS